MNSQVPALKSGLLKQSLEGQTLIFDPSTDGVHLLDRTTGIVFDLMQAGGWTEEAIATELERQLTVKDGSEFYALAIQQLDNAKLLEEPAEPTWEKVDRREVIRRVVKVGLSTLLVPAVVTVTASPAHAASFGFKCDQCTSSAQCSGGKPCGSNGACQDNGLPYGAACSATANQKAGPPPFCGTTAPKNANSTCCSNRCIGGTIVIINSVCQYTVPGQCQP